MNVNMNQKSKYVNMTAEKCLKHHLLYCRVPSCILLIILFVLCYMYIFVFSNDIFFLLYMLAAFFSILLSRINVFFRLRKLQDILFLDCDPQKHLEVIKLLSENDKKKRAWSTFHLLMARDYYSLYDYAALGECLAQIHFRKWRAVREIAVLNVSGNYYLKTKQMEAYEKCNMQLLQMRRDPIIAKKYGQLIENVIETWNFMISIEKGEEKEARKILESSRYAKIKNPYEAVSWHFSAARVELLAGNTEKAIEHLDFVIEYGNTLGHKRESINLLNELRERKAEQVNENKQ